MLLWLIKIYETLILKDSQHQNEWPGFYGCRYLAQISNFMAAAFFHVCKLNLTVNDDLFACRF